MRDVGGLGFSDIQNARAEFFFFWQVVGTRGGAKEGVGIRKFDLRGTRYILQNRPIGKHYIS